MGAPSAGKVGVPAVPLELLKARAALEGEAELQDALAALIEGLEERPLVSAN
jgi:hypothetical protein